MLNINYRYYPMHIQFIHLVKLLLRNKWLEIIVKPAMNIACRRNFLSLQKDYMIIGKLSIAHAHHHRWHLCLQRRVNEVCGRKTFQLDKFTRILIATQKKNNIHPSKLLYLIVFHCKIQRSAKTRVF